MSFDISLGPVDFDEFDERYASFNPGISEPSLHQAIFLQSGSPHQSIRMGNVSKNPSAIDQKSQTVARNHRIMPMGNVSGEIGGKISWGGENGVQASGYVSGSASDDNGNTAEITVEVNSDGSGSASASASHEEKTDS